MRSLKLFIISIIVLFSSGIAAQDKPLPVKNDFVNFDNIKNILKKDGLEKSIAKKKKTRKKRIKKRIDSSKRLYTLPVEEDFWRIMTEYWLVKNITILKWDFHKPDYGVRDYFEEFLKTVGSLGVSFNVLYTNSTHITHFGFPFGKNEYLFVISVPFIKIMDLSKLEISILLYEDLMRLEFGQFKAHFDPKLVEKLKDGNFYKKEYPKKELLEFSLQLDKLVYEKGFNFKQQYQVTKRMNIVLTSNKKLWQNYYSLLGKIDNLTKSNLVYKNYVKIYPSPELQRNWINPIKN